MTAATAFTTISLFNLLQFPFAFLPMGLAQYSQSLVSTRRLLNFFVSEELGEYVSRDDHKNNIAIEMNNLSVCWVKETEGEGVVEEEGTDKIEAMMVSKVDRLDPHEQTLRAQKEAAEAKAADALTAEEKESQAVAAAVTDKRALINRSAQTLSDMNLVIPKGALVAVVGAVGSGKSSFLSAILGEMHAQTGSVNVVGSVAYCEQRPWILNATVEQNILFGEPMNLKRFDAAIHAASLADDIKVLPGGIQTEIGERGINLSGGQKARVALARAVYKNCDTYLLDDPLSAVGKHSHTLYLLTYSYIYAN